MVPSPDERRCERLRTFVAGILAETYPELAGQFMVTDVAINARIAFINGSRSVMSTTTLGDDPWTLLGLYHAETLRIERLLIALQEDPDNLEEELPDA